VEDAGSTQAGVDEPGAIVRRLEDSPGIKAQWERYVESQWWPWAIEERCLQPVQSIYNELFAAYQNQERLGEAYEVVVGVGLLAWRPPHSPKSNATSRQRRLSSSSIRRQVPSPSDHLLMVLGWRSNKRCSNPRPPLPELQNRIQQELIEVGDAIWAGPALITA